MLEGVMNTSAFRLHLITFCAVITNIWLDISNSYIARGHFFLGIFQKGCIKHMPSKSQKKQRLIVFIIVNAMKYLRTLGNNIHHSNKQGPPTFFHLDTNPLYVVTFGSILLTKPIFWLYRSWSGSCSWIYFLSTLFQLWTNKSLLGWQVYQKMLWKTPYCCSNQTYKLHCFSLDMICAIQSDYVPFLADVCHHSQCICVICFYWVHLLLECCLLQSG